MRAVKIIFILIFALLIAGERVLFHAISPHKFSGEFSSSGILKFSTEEVSSQQHVSDKTIRVLTYNIGYASGLKNNQPIRLTKAEVEQNLNEMVKVIQANQPDLLFLQEVDFEASRTHQINQLEFLAKSLSFPYAAYVVTWNKNYVPWPYWPPSGHFGKIVSGQALLSRFPILDQQLIPFQKPKSNPAWYNWFYLDRIVQKITLQQNDKSLVVWNVHLEAFDSKARTEQAQKLVEEIKKEPSGRQIVAGDFNSPSLFKEGLDENQKKDLEDRGEAFRIFQSSTGFSVDQPKKFHWSMPSQNPIKKIDMIFYSNEFQQTEAEVTEGVLASDHLPVSVSLEARH